MQEQTWSHEIEIISVAFDTQLCTNARMKIDSEKNDRDTDMENMHREKPMTINPVHLTNPRDLDDLRPPHWFSPKCGFPCLVVLSIFQKQPLHKRVYTDEIRTRNSWFQSILWSCLCLHSWDPHIPNISLLKSGKSTIQPFPLRSIYLVARWANRTPIFYSTLTNNQLSTRYYRFHPSGHITSRPSLPLLY